MANVQLNCRIPEALAIDGEGCDGRWRACPADMGESLIFSTASPIENQ